MAHVNREARLLLNSVIHALEPAIPPAHCGFAPFEFWARLGFVRIRVVPWAEQRFHRRFQVHHHARQIVAVPIVEAANEIDGNLNRIVDGLLKRLEPKCAIALMAKIEKKPRRDMLFVRGKIRGLRHLEFLIHA